MMRYWITGIVLGLTTGISIAQDSLIVLGQERFIDMVLKYHPVARQSDLVLEMGEYGLKKARGNFDPYLFTYYDGKQFDDKNYFSILGTGLIVPAWFGMDIKFGYDRNRGIYLNPENNLPANGLWYAGISLPLGEGLVIDERRKVVQQARLFSQYTRVEQNLILNGLILNALESYWNWVKTHNQLNVYREFMDLAIERYEGIKGSFEQGDRPAIDTLEAYIQLQNREIEINQCMIEIQKATLELSNFLWFEDNLPLEISDGLISPDLTDPEIDVNLTNEDLNDVLSRIEDNHPELQLYEYKLADLHIEQRWKKEKIKPKVNVNYHILNEASGEGINTNEFDNYKWGFEFSMPLLFRSGIGDLRLTQIKMKEAEFNRSQKSLEVTNKVLAYYRQLQNLAGQIRLYDGNVVNYERLLNGERKKFSAGESSLFLINSREMSLIEARIKLLEVMTKTRITYWSFHWASGKLLEQFSDGGIL